MTFLSCSRFSRILLEESEQVISLVTIELLPSFDPFFRDAIRYQISCFFIKFQNGGGGVIPVYKNL